MDVIVLNMFNITKNDTKKLSDHVKVLLRLSTITKLNLPLAQLTLNAKNQPLIVLILLPQIVFPQSSLIPLSMVEDHLKPRKDI